MIKIPPQFVNDPANVHNLKDLIKAKKQEVDNLETAASEEVCGVHSEKFDDQACTARLECEDIEYVLGVLEGKDAPYNDFTHMSVIGDQILSLRREYLAQAARIARDGATERPCTHLKSASACLEVVDKLGKLYHRLYVADVED